MAYTDDDVVLHPWWLERMAGAFDADHIWAVTGLVLPAELATQPNGISSGIGVSAAVVRARNFARFPGSMAAMVARLTWLIVAGASMAFRCSAFARAGFFDERLDVGAAGCSGDSEFWHRLLCAGGTCRYEPSVVAFHYHRRDWPGLRKQIRAYMRGHAAALLVQYERSGRKGNLRRLFVSFPQFYGRRLLKRSLSKGDASDLLLGEEIAGLLSGIWFYARTKRPGVSPS